MASHAIIIICSVLYHYTIYSGFVNDEKLHLVVRFSVRKHEKTPKNQGFRRSFVNMNKFHLKNLLSFIWCFLPLNPQYFVSCDQGTHEM